MTYDRRLVYTLCIYTGAYEGEGVSNCHKNSGNFEKQKKVPLCCRPKLPNMEVRLLIADITRVISLPVTSMEAVRSNFGDS